MNLSTKDTIIESAIELFSERGYTESNLRSIAALSGISPASIYNYFSSKEEILKCIFDMYYQKMSERVASREEIIEMLPISDTVDIIKRALFQLNETEQLTYAKIIKIILQEQYRNEEAGNFVKYVLFDEVEDYLCFVLTRLLEARRIRPIDPTLYARVINEINIASIVEYSHYTPVEYFQKVRHTRMDITNQIINSIII